MNYLLKSQRDINYYSCLPLENSGLWHGFCDNSIDFQKNKRKEARKEFCKIFNVSELFLLEQVHGVEIVSVLDADVSITELLITQNSEAQNIADAFIIDTKIIKKEQKFAFGILSADCIPLIIKFDSLIALVHAGWRDLANGIIVRTMQNLVELGQIQNFNPDVIMQIAIGPCANASSSSPNCYEIGKEVIAQIGKHAASTSDSAGRIFLNLSQSAENIIYSERPENIEIYPSNLCTMSNINFFSHRRQSKQPEFENANDKIGRNMSFVVV